MWRDRPGLPGDPGLAVQPRAGGRHSRVSDSTFYMIQDAHYLGAFARRARTAAAGAPTPETQTSSPGAQGRHRGRARVHEGFFRRARRHARRSPPPGPRRPAAATGDFLVATAYPAPVRGRRCRALLPCFQIYYGVGKRLASIAAAPNRTSAGSTPTGQGFDESVRGILAHTDAARTAASGREPSADARGHLKAVRYEMMFSDSASRLEGSAGLRPDPSFSPSPALSGPRLERGPRVARASARPATLDPDQVR